jgi:hypothetical protein
MKVANVFVVALLNSPLHVFLSKRLLVLTYTGRASGKRYRIPVGYRRDGALVTLVAGNPWWVNLRDGGAVRLRLAGTEVCGTALPLADKRQAEAALTAFIEQLPHLATMYDVTLAPDKRPDGASVARAINTQVVIQVALEANKLSA